MPEGKGEWDGSGSNGVDIGFVIWEDFERWWCPAPVFPDSYVLVPKWGFL